MFKQFITNRTINKKPVVVCHAPALSLWFRWLLLLRKAWPQSGINQLSVLPFISLGSHWREGMGLRVLASDEKLPSSPWHLNKPWPSPTQHPLRLPKYAFAFIIREKQIATAKPGTIIYLANFFFQRPYRTGHFICTCIDRCAGSFLITTQFDQASVKVIRINVRL